MKVFMGIILTVILLVTAVFSANYVLANKPLSKVLESDSRNSGVNVKAHFKGYVQPSILAIDVQSVSGSNSTGDVFRVLLQYASQIKDKKFDTILLQSKGKTKFFLQGDYFQNLGKEYGTQNPVYTMRTFPENIYDPDGNKAFGQWTGGFFGVLNQQMKDFGEFHSKWYIEDI